MWWVDHFSGVLRLFVREVELVSDFDILIMGWNLLIFSLPVNVIFLRKPTICSIVNESENDQIMWIFCPNQINYNFYDNNSSRLDFGINLKKKQSWHTLF